MFIEEKIIVSQEERKAIDIFVSLLEKVYKDSHDDDILDMLDMVSILKENLATFNDFTVDEC